MALTQEDIEQIQKLIKEEISHIPEPPNANVRYELDLRERTIRVEQELKHQRELMIKGFEQMEKRFELMQTEMNKRFEQVDKRFEQVDKRFEQIDKRFEQVDKRFEQVDKRFEQIIHSIDRLSDNLDKRDVVQRSFTMRMFSISIMISFIGVLGVALKLFGI